MMKTMLNISKINVQALCLLQSWAAAFSSSPGCGALLEQVGGQLHDNHHYQCPHDGHDGHDDQNRCLASERLEWFFRLCLNKSFSSTRDQGHPHIVIIIILFLYILNFNTIIVTSLPQSDKLTSAIFSRAHPLTSPINNHSSRVPSHGPVPMVAHHIIS